MVKLFTPLICVMLLIFMASATLKKKPLHRGRVKGVANKVQELAHSVATTIKNLKVTSSREKTELIIMANEFAYKIHSVAYTINQAVSSIEKEDYKVKVQALILNIEDQIHEIQHGIYEDAGKLQGKLVTALEAFAGFFDKGLEIMNQHHEDSATFISNQIRECTDIFIWASFKLQFQAVFFTKTNKDLDKEFDSRFDNLKGVIQKIKVDDEETKDELLYLVQHLGQLTNSAIFKLQHWLNINEKNDKSVIIVKDVADTLSDLYNKLHILTVSNLGVFDIIKQFKEIYFSGAGKIKKLANAVPNETLGGQEFIRSVLYDCLTVATTFSAELEIFLEKKNAN